MFDSFWDWFLVAVVVAGIFYANRLPELKELAKEKLKPAQQMLEKGKAELDKKVAQVKEMQKKTPSDETNDQQTPPEA